MLQNVVIGKPICEPWLMFSNTPEEFENSDRDETLFTEERFLPRILVDCGVVKSIGEVRRKKLLMPHILCALEKQSVQ